MIQNFCALVAAVADGSLKHVAIKITRKRDGVYVSVEAFTGHHTYGLASYVLPPANRKHPPKPPRASTIIEVCGRRLAELRVILEAQ